MRGARSPALSHKKRRRLLLQFSAKTTASGWLPCSKFCHPSISSTMLSVAFALQTLLVGCDWPYFRTCDSPVTGIIFSILSKFECACRLIKKGPSEADKLLRQTPFPLRIILLYLFVSPAGAALSDTLLPAVHPGPSNCTGPSSYCSRSLRQQ